MLDDKALDEILEQVWQNGNKPVRQGKSYLYNTEAKAKLQSLHNEGVRKAAEEGLRAYLLGTIELLKTVTPARPEDLSLGQWYGLVEAIKAATQEAQDSLAQLNKEGEV